MVTHGIRQHLYLTWVIWGELEIGRLPIVGSEPQIKIPLVSTQLNTSIISPDTYSVLSATIAPPDHGLVIDVGKSASIAFIWLTAASDCALGPPSLTYTSTVRDT